MDENEDALDPSEPISLKQIPKEKIKKILLIRPDNLGDMVFATALMKGLKDHFSHASLSVLLKENAMDIVSPHPLVDEVILDWYSQGKIQSKKEEKTYVDFLKEKKFDVAINLLFHPNPYADLARRAKIPHRLGDKGILAQGWKYNDGVYLNWKDLSRHEIEYLFDLVKPLGIHLQREALPKMTLSIDKEKQEKVKTFLHQHAFLERNAPLIVIHPGTSGGNKPWHEEGFANLISKLQKTYQAKIVLTGGPDEKDLTERIEKKALAQGGNPKDLLNLSARFSVAELSALLTLASLYIGGDTGPTHMASALGVPVLDIFPSKQKKPARWAPWGTRHLVVKPISECPEPCHPRICPLDICQKEISVDVVFENVKRLLGGGGLVGREETLYDWCKKTFNLLWLTGKIPQKKILPWGEALKKMKNEGFHIALHSEKENDFTDLAKGLGISTYIFPIFPTRKTVDQFIQLIVKEDINLFHYLFRRKKMTETFIRLLSAFKIPNPPLAIREDSVPENPSSLFNHYRACFQGKK